VSSVLVTGSSSGFGELIARSLATRGHHVYASMRETAGRNMAAAQRLSEWAATNGHALRVVDLDVTSDASVGAAVEQVLASASGLDAVVNNAGASAMGPLEAFTIPQMASLLDLNVLGQMRVNKAVLPNMRARRAGTKHAPRATPISSADIPTKVAGSVALTPNNRLDITRVNATAAVKPAPRPARASDSRHRYLAGVQPPGRHLPPVVAATYRRSAGVSIRDVR